MKVNKIIAILMLIFIILSCASTTVFANLGKEEILREYHEEINKESEDLNIASSSALKKLEGYKKAGLITEDEYIKIRTASGFRDKVLLKEKLDAFMDEWRTILVYATTFGTLSAFLVFILIFLRLSFLPSHPIERRKAMIDIVTSGVSTALLGGISLILSIFYETFNGIIDNGIIFSTNWKVSFNILLYEYRIFIIGLLGLATLTLILMFIKSFMSLAVSANNPGKRSQALNSVLLTGLASLGIGGLTFWVYFFVESLK